jgi:lysophospholipase L1-like esterase
MKKKLLTVLALTGGIFLALETGARIFSTDGRAGILSQHPGLAMYAGMERPEEVFSLLNPGCLEWSPYQHWVVRPNLRSRFYRTNALGLRGLETAMEKPDGRFRIVVLGGSAAWGLGSTADERSLPGRLEAHLRERNPSRELEVINAGQPGYTSGQELIYFHRLISRMNPDLVLLFDGYNDIDADLHNSQPGWPENANILRARYDASFSKTRLSQEFLDLLRSSRFLHLASQKLGASSPAGEASGETLAAPEVTAMNYVHNVKALARLASPAPVWVALQPVVATVRKPLAPEEREILAAKEKIIPGYTERVRRTYRRIEEQLRAAAIPFLDLNAALGEQPRLLFADECHFGDEAADDLAGRIAAVCERLIQ